MLRHLTPFAFLALVPLGGVLGGGWTFLAAVATPLCLVALDNSLGDEAPVRADGRFASAWLPRLYVALQLAVNAWAALRIAGPSATIVETAGLALSAAATTGVFGFVAAHELIHSPQPRERALGLGFLASVLYMHFRIAHVYGHHRRAGTLEDPATARLGESLYSFLPRTIIGQFREAWMFEARRLQRVGRTAWSLENRMVLYGAVEVLCLLLAALASLRVFGFFVVVSAVAIALLETFNYVAHYGLLRSVGADGRVERLAPKHAWNVRRRMNNAALFNMGRHSDHHRVMTRRYGELEPVVGAAELPSGYASALLMALVPPIWRRVMDPRALSAMRRD